MQPGQNLLNWAQGEIMAVFLLIVIVGAVLLAWKRQTTALFGFVIIMSILGAIVAKPDIFIGVGTKIWNIIF